MRPILSAFAIAALSCATRPAPPPPQQPKPASQNPSPMVENTRAHERLQKLDVPGVRFTVEGVLAKPVDVLITPAGSQGDAPDLLVHFHSAAWVPMQAAVATGRPLIVAAVNLGAGGGLYDRSLSDPATFPALVAAIANEASARSGREVKLGRRYASGFSAGYGAIRAILRNDADALDGVMLLDGLHTSYIPDRKPIADGGKLDEVPLSAFAAYARLALDGRKTLVITHSEIFPGTFASTTETTDWLLGQLGLKRVPVVKWGPGGMQQLSEVSQGRLTVMGFAGNSAPDHIDHLHGMGVFLQVLLGGK